MSIFRLNFEEPGFPDLASAWLSTSDLLARWYLHAFVPLGWKDGLAKPPSLSLLDGVPPAKNGELVDRLAKRLLGISLLSAQQTALTEFLDGVGCTEPAQTMQAGMNMLIWMVLNTPQWLQR